MRTINILIILITTTLLYSCAAPGSLNLPKDENGNYEYQGVVEVEGKSQTELFDEIKEWTALNFRSAQDVIQLEDRDNGIFIAKGYIPVMMKMYERYLYHTLRVETREGRYRYTINDFEIFTPSTNERYSLEKAMISQNDGDKVDTVIKELLGNIETHLKEESEDW